MLLFSNTVSPNVWKGKIINLSFLRLLYFSCTKAWISICMVSWVRYGRYFFWLSIGLKQFSRAYCFFFFFFLPFADFISVITAFCLWLKVPFFSESMFFFVCLFFAFLGVFSIHLTLTCRFASHFCNMQHFSFGVYITHIFAAFYWFTVCIFITAAANCAS